MRQVLVYPAKLGKAAPIVSGPATELFNDPHANLLSLSCGRGGSGKLITAH